jgi:cell division septum initiation protein DivIVA
MTIEQHSASSSLIAQPSVQAAPGRSFSDAQRGYHKGEVDNWVQQAQYEIARLTRAAEHAGQQAFTFLRHEADSPQGQQLLGDLAKLMMDEITGQRAAAAADIEQMIAGAHQQAEQILADARAKADQAVSRATQQASTLLDSARSDAKNTVDQAEAHAAAVHEAAGARLAQIVKIHQDTLDQVSQVNAKVTQIASVTSQVMAAEQQRGDVSGEVTRALAPVTQLQPTAQSPAQPSARPR